ncbi:MAG: hypothetical protein ACOCX4_10505 [Planctomycetota bacterium]
MEYKKRVLKKRKAQQARNRKARGMIRVKVRGRKRWIQPAAVVEQ